MKRIVIGIGILAVFIIATSAAAVEWANYSGSKAASAAITTGEGVFYGVIIMTDSTTAITVNVYDNTAASGSKIIPEVVIPTSAAYRSQAIYPPVPIRYYNGIYVSISSTDCAYEVYYRPE